MYLVSAINPVWKVRIVVCRHEDQLFIDSLFVDGDLLQGTVDDENHAPGTTSDLNLKRKRCRSELHDIDINSLILGICAIDFML